MEDWRNEKMGEQGAGSSTMSARSAPPLEPKTAALVGVAAAIAAGETAELEARLAAARGAGVPVLWIEELLLQSLLVVGYPLALVAFGVWRKVSGPLPDHGSGHDAEQLAHARSEEHTSELQSRLHLVCRLLLEKKKKERTLAHDTLEQQTQH